MHIPYQVHIDNGLPYVGWTVQSSINDFSTEGIYACMYMYQRCMQNMWLRGGRLRLSKCRGWGETKVYLCSAGRLLSKSSRGKSFPRADEHPLPLNTALYTVCTLVSPHTQSSYRDSKWRVRLCRGDGCRAEKGGSETLCPQRLSDAGC